MKLAIFVFLFVIFNYVNAYTTRFNHIDIDAILKNERLLNVYLKCVLEGKGCTSEGNELKKLLPDAIKTGCSKCNDQQRRGAVKVFRFLIREKPKVWEQVIDKYDPKKIYRTQWDPLIKA